MPIQQQTFYLLALTQVRDMKREQIRINTTWVGAGYVRLHRIVGPVDAVTVINSKLVEAHMLSGIGVAMKQGFKGKITFKVFCRGLRHRVKRNILAG